MKEIKIEEVIPKIDLPFFFVNERESGNIPR